jgi:hypothetical protein
MSAENVNSAQEYREAAESYLGGAKVDAAGIFQRPPSMTGGGLERILDWLNDLLEGRLGLLRGRFLLVVTPDRVYAFRFKDVGVGLRIEEEIASFDRDEVRLRSYAGGELFHLSATERGRIREIDLDGEAVTEASGAPEVIAALSE